MYIDGRRKSGSDTFIKDTGTKDVMHMMFDIKNNQSARAMESFLKNYTEQVEPLYSYEKSKIFLRKRV